jgi:hypothetical protein
VEYRSLVGRKLGQQMGPVALDNAANFRVDLRDVIETGFNLPPDQIETAKDCPLLLVKKLL